MKTRKPVPRFRSPVHCKKLLERTMNRRMFLTASVAVVAANGAWARGSNVVFHFYGAQDCPPCMAFKRNHLADVQKEGQRLGFLVEENIIRRTADVPVEGSYGERDAILRVAAPQLEIVYPPIFFVSLGGKIRTVHGADWRSALESAVSALE